MPESDGSPQWKGTTVVYETIVLCQPDRRKSCTACCGLFNYMDISRERLTAFLTEGAARSSSCFAQGNTVDRGDGEIIRDPASYICPHQGLIFNRRPGCLLHPLYRDNDMRNSAFFGESICDGFTCPAHSVLSAGHKRLIIDLIDDWYIYSVALIDPDSTAWLLTLLEEEYRITFENNKNVKIILDECLMIHADYMARYRGPLFFYSLPEYTIGKKGFSLPDGSAHGGDEVREIVAAIKRHI